MQSIFAYEIKNSGVRSGAELFAAMSKDGVFRTLVGMQFLSREFYEKNQSNFYEGILHEDDPFSCISVLRAERVSHRKRSLYYYRRRSMSITGAPLSFNNIYGKLIGIMEIVKFMQGGNFSPGVRKMMSKHLRWTQGAMKIEYDSLSAAEKSKADKLNAEEKEALAFYLGDIRDFGSREMWFVRAYYMTRDFLLPINSGRREFVKGIVKKFSGG